MEQSAAVNSLVSPQKGQIGESSDQEIGRDEKSELKQFQSDPILKS